MCKSARGAVVEVCRHAIHTAVRDQLVGCLQRRNKYILGCSHMQLPPCANSMVCFHRRQRRRQASMPSALLAEAMAVEGLVAAMVVEQGAGVAWPGTP